MPAAVIGLSILAAVLATGLGVMIGRRTSAGPPTASGTPATQFALPKNFKTSVAGIVTAAAGFVMFSPEDFVQWPWAVHLAKFVTIGGLASIGILSRDYNAHSTVTETLAASEKAADPAAKHLAAILPTGQGDHV